MWLDGHQVRVVVDPVGIASSEGALSEGLGSESGRHFY